MDRLFHIFIKHDYTGVKLFGQTEVTSSATKALHNFDVKFFSILMFIFFDFLSVSKF